MTTDVMFSGYRFSILAMFLWRGCMIFLAERLRDFCFLLVEVAWIFCGEVAWFVVERLRAFLVKRLNDFFCGEFAWFFQKKTCEIVCMERLHDFSHSLNHSGCMNYFFLEVAWFSFAERLCDLFVEKFAWFFVWRGCLILIVKRLHDFCLKRFLVIKKSYLV